MKTLSIPRKICMGVAALPFLLACLASHSLANTITANSASYNDVSNAVASASAGDTVIIPPGTAAWTETLNFSGIHLEGSGPNQTIITDEMANNNPAVISMAAVTNALTELSDLTVAGGTYIQENTGGNVYASGGSNTTWRVTDVVFTNLAGIYLGTFGSAECVVDHCTFYLSDPNDENIAIQDTGNDSVDGNVSWASPPTYGLSSSNCLYVENNTIVGLVAESGVAAFDAHAGARDVFRYNTVSNANWNNHGTESGGMLRSERSFEVYNNSFFYTNQPDYPANDIAFIRGGSGIIYSNTVTGNCKSLVDLRSYRYMLSYSGQWYPFDGANGTNTWDSIGTGTYPRGTSGAGPQVSYLYDPNAAWTPNQWADGSYILNNLTAETFAPITSNSVNTIYYMDENWITQGTNMTFNNGDTYAIYQVNAALDQPGRGSGDLVGINEGADYADESNTVTGTISWPNEVLEGIYCWSNTIDGSDAGMSSYYPGIQEGRDFYNDTPKPGYTPFPYPHPLDVSVPSGLAAWWKFDEGSGTVAHDSSGNGNDGTLGGSTLPQWTNGALYFNGSGYISAGTNNVPITFPMTISYWVNFSAGGGGTVASRLQWNSAADWLCFDSTADVPVANADLDHLSLPTAIDDGNWHLVTETVTDNGNGTGTPNIYLDGNLQEGSPYGADDGPTTVGTPTISIGIEQDYTTSPFIGYIDDVRIYTNALSSTDIATLYSSGRQ